MFSLNKIATFALLALGVSANVIPAKRDDTTVVAILETLKTTVEPMAQQFTTLTPETATPSAVQSIVDSINAEITKTNTQLAAAPPGSIPEGGDSTQALADVFNAVLQPANTLATTPGVDFSGIEPIFNQLGVTLAQLLQNVVTLVKEVLQLVVQILNGLILGLSGLGGLGGILGGLGGIL